MAARGRGRREQREMSEDAAGHAVGSAGGEAVGQEWCREEHRAGGLSVQVSGPQAAPSVHPCLPVAGQGRVMDPSGRVWGALWGEEPQELLQGQTRD